MKRKFKFFSLELNVLFPKIESKKKEMSSGLPIWISDELEAWPEKDGPIRFSQIAGLHSEFIGISLKGELHQWRWSDTEAYRNVEVIYFYFFILRLLSFK